MLQIRLLGELELRVGDGRLPPLESARARSLLAYLLLHRDAPQSRQRLAFLLWPDSSEPQARTNLRHVLHNLRRALPDADRFLEVTPQTLRWHPDAPFRLDVAAFEEALARDALQAAVDAYAGDLLEGSYDEWLLEERERLRERYLDALERLAALLEERREHADAIRYAERLVRQDPLRERTYRLLMRLHDARGDRARALRAYHACAAALDRDLGVGPSAATREAYEALLTWAGEPDAAPRGGRVLVGRARERARLTELWGASQRGRAQLVLVTGEAGIGKTRLVEELAAWCAHRRVPTAEARSYRAEGALAYAPVAAWLRAEPLAARRDRLDRGALAELARVLPELGEAPRPPVVADGALRQRLFAALARAIAAPGAPLLLIADDLHWADAETLQFLHYLLRSMPDAPLLVAATARLEEVETGHALSELVSGLRTLERVSEIALRRLSRDETAVLAQRLGGRALESPAADRLFADSEGNPLFVVEALRASGPLSPRVQAVIEARLDRLSVPARELAGIGASIGRAFTTDVLAAASGADQETLVRGLDELWRRGIVRERGADAYDFSHDKLREVAYGALSPARRSHYHLRVARALARLHPGEPAPVAAHYDRAGAAGDAVPWYARAAARAQRMHANHDAIRALERALDLVRSPSRHELDLLTGLLAPLALVEGFGSARLAAVQQRAQALARELGTEPEPPLLRSLALAALSAGDFERARRRGEDLRLRGERERDDVQLVESGYVLGISAFWRGEPAAARRHFEEAVARYRPEHRPTHILRYGLDPKVICLSRLANALWFLGDPDGAVRAGDRALALAEEIEHPPTHATVLVFAALLALELRDEPSVRHSAAALGAWGGEHPTRVTQLTAEALAGYVDVLDGRRADGLARLRGALDAAREGEHAPGQWAATVRLLLEASAVAGDARGGLAAADLALAADRPVRLWEAETRRLRAEFLARLDAPGDEVRAELERAVAVARAQGAVALEARALESLRNAARNARGTAVLDPRSR